MMMPARFLFAATGGALALLGLVACSHSGGDADPVSAPLTSKAGAVRELGMLGQILADGAPLFGLERAEPLFANLRFTASPNGPSTFCQDGAVASEDGERDESLQYFAATRRFAYTRYTFAECEWQNARADIRQHGVVEQASEAQNDPTDLADSYDYYAEYGDDAAPYVYEVSVFSGAPVTEQVTGRFEWRFWDYGLEVRSVLTRRVTRPQTADGELLFQQGRTDAPFQQPPVLGSRVAVDGPYRYDSEVCGAAERTILGQLERSDRGYPRSGQLTIASPEGESLTADFDADGNAMLSFSDGGTAALSADEIRQAFEMPAC